MLGFHGPSEHHADVFKPVVCGMGRSAALRSRKHANGLRRKPLDGEISKRLGRAGRDRLAAGSLEHAATVHARMVGEAPELRGVEVEGQQPSPRARRSLRAPPVAGAASAAQRSERGKRPSLASL